MSKIFLKDMIYRQARVVLTIIGITLLIALILFLGGIMNGMKIQARQYVESTGADIWISAKGSGGAFIGFSLLVPEYLAFLRHDKRLTADSVSPLVFAQARPIIRGKAGKAIVVGYKRDKHGGPRHAIEGRMFTPSEFEDYRPQDLPLAEVVVDEKMGLTIGERITIGGKELKVVGKTKSLMFVLDTPLLFMDIRTAQDVLLDNYLHVNMMIAKSKENHNVSEIATDLNQQGSIEVRTLDQTLDDIIDTYVDEPMKAVTFLRVMLCLAAFILVTMITYVTTLEKTQEIGILKAIGASNHYVMLLILKQVALTSVIGVIFGLILSYLFAIFAPIFVKIDPVESAVVAAISFKACCAGGYLAGYRATLVDPMVAFRGEI